MNDISNAPVGEGSPTRTTGARVVHQARSGYNPRGAQEQFIVPLLAEAIERGVAEHGRDNSDGLRQALDVGCGGQPFRDVIRTAGLAYHSLDVVQNAAGTVEHIGALDKPLPASLVGQTFEFVLCTEVLEHVADWHAAFANLSQLVSPGGRLLLTCPHVYPLHEAPYDYWRPTPFAIKAFAERHGFEIVETRQLGTGWDVLGSVAAACSPLASTSMRGRILAALGNLVRGAIYVVMRSRIFQRHVPVTTGVYLSNFAVLRRADASRTK
jgi:SAM-dependent methyltransferase